MSDTSDFRGGSREQKRQDETVMLNSDNLSDMVSQAKDGDPPAATPKPSSSAASADDEALGSTPFARILVLLGIIVIILVAAYLIYDKVIG